MSHYVSLVILPKDTGAAALKAALGGDRDALEQAVEPLLAQYDENIQVPEYDKECYCVGREARTRAMQGARAEAGPPPARDFMTKETPDQITAFALWERVYDEVESRLYAADPECGKPNPACASQADGGCGGSGLEKTQYNPLSKWDWYAVGGRWSGMLGEYDPTQYEHNYEPCDVCNGTGSRPGTDYSAENMAWVRGGNASDPFHQVIGAGCNGCMGTGWQFKFASDLVVPLDGNARPLLDLDLTSSDNWIPFAIVTPDGAWHEKAKMGWWAMTTGNQTAEEWQTEARGLALQYKEHVAVVVDLHI